MFAKRSVFSFFMLVLIVVSWLYYIGNQYSYTATSPADSNAFSDITKEYDWAKEAIYAMAEKGVISGMTKDTFEPEGSVTREQFAKMLVRAFMIPLSNDKTQIFEDVPTSRWSFAYISSAKDLMDINESRFQPTKAVTREEAASTIVKVLGFIGDDVRNKNALYDNFSDAVLVAPHLEDYVIIAFENNLIGGIDGKLRPFDLIRRAEIAVMLHRALNIREPLGRKTKIIGPPEVSIEAAKQWAKRRGAHQRFIDIAPVYWKYGEQTGIRPEVLYCQAAKETDFGKYTGRVRADMNNWAGIKRADAVGDETEAHETFASADEGVLAHFNHMAAYVGTNPIGTPHGRYEVVKNCQWAGTVEFVEDLGGKWAPDQGYGKSIVNDYLSDLVPELK